MLWLWLIGLSGLLYFALGWPADGLARNPAGWAGLTWVGLTFVSPVALWALLVVAFGPIDPGGEAGGLVFIFGWAVCVAGNVAGTFVARVTRRR